MTASQSSAKCRKDKIARGYKRIPDLISAVAAENLRILLAEKWSDSQTGVIERALSLARHSIKTNSPA